jgi:hypothetical protein
LFGSTSIFGLLYLMNCFGFSTILLSFVIFSGCCFITLIKRLLGIGIGSYWFGGDGAGISGFSAIGDAMGSTVVGGILATS